MDIRSRRLEELIKIKLSSLLVKGLKDPRLDSFITILGVMLSKDRRTAEVVISVIGSETEKKKRDKGIGKCRWVYSDEDGERVESEVYSSS